MIIFSRLSISTCKINYARNKLVHNTLSPEQHTKHMVEINVRLTNWFTNRQQKSSNQEIT